MCACARWTPSFVFDAVREHGVTHYCDAPIVHSTLITRSGAAQRHSAQGPCDGRCAAPPAAMIEGMERMGWEADPRVRAHRVYGPATVCAKRRNGRASISASAPRGTAARGCAISWRRD